jgi:hypothetical protein
MLTSSIKKGYSAILRIQNISQNFARRVIDRVPQPALMLLITHKTPHLVHFRRLDAFKDNFDKLSLKQLLQ